MFLNELNLRHFRNYESMDLSFDRHVNIFLGENAQGKTNVLEAIYVLSLAKSHRTSKDRELIRWDEDFARIQGRFQKKSGQVNLELILSVKGKKGKVSELEQKRLSDYIGVANVVMFAPEDLDLVKGSPQVRRRFLDMEIGQINRVYLHHLGQYQKVLKQRNHLLKSLQQKQGSIDMLHVLTEQLIQLAAEIISRRFRFVIELKKWAKQIHHSISKGKEELGVHYLPSSDVLEEMDLSKIEEVLHETYTQKQEREIMRGITLFGPHRDDLGFTVNGHDVQTYGSQGQQRTTALALKLAEIDLIHSEIGEYPILLLDDVLSELDDSRQSYLLKTIQDKGQTFITATSVDGIDENILREAALFSVVKGDIRKES